MASRRLTTNPSITSALQNMAQSTPLARSSETNPIEEDEDIEEEIEDIICAIDQRGSTLGCAVYTEINQKLSLMEDICLAKPEFITSLIAQIEPNVLLYPSRMDDCLEESVKGSENDQTTPYRISVRPSGEYHYETAKFKLAALRIGKISGPVLNAEDDNELLDMDGDQRRQENLIRLSSWINTNSKVTVGCAGAILAYLQRKRDSEYIAGDPRATVFVAAVEMFSLKDTMFINTDTIHSLQIFEDEGHPSIHMQNGSGRGKEGLSLFGILNLTKTPNGFLLLKQWFLRPTLSLPVLQQRHSAIACFLLPQNIHLAASIRKDLRKIKNIPKVLKDLRTGRGKIGDWSAILAFAVGTLQIQGHAQEMEDNIGLKIFRKTFDTFDVGALRSIGTLIQDTVDFPQSHEHRRMVVKPGVDQELDGMKQTFEALESILSEVASKIALELPPQAGAILNVVYIPQLGYLLAFPLDPVTRQSAYSQEDWEFQFSTEEHFYYKSHHMREMDDHYGDINGLICDREIELMYDLQVRVLEYEALLVACSDVCSELDCLLALAEGATKNKYCRPHMTERNIIDIKKGRHPLQELCVSSFIENDTKLEGGSGEQLDVNIDEGGENEPNPSMLLLTGPNYSGKSVYLKQVAMIVYMAHTGSYVPAEHATIGLTDRILTRIQTKESVSKIESAFVIDLQQISLSLRLATRRSLLIIDEFGKGTDVNDGAGLACGVFEHLLNLDTERPKVIACTHFHEIFENGFLTPRPYLEFAYMKILLNAQADDVSDQITYLYRLEKGRSTSSFGTCCAALNGIDPAIVSRAEDLILMAARGEDLIAACIKLTEAEKVELTQAEAIARAFLAWDLDDEDDSDVDGNKVGESKIKAKLGKVLAAGGVH